MACEMMANDYRRFDTRQLKELGAQSRRSEEDFQRRLDARLRRSDLPNSPQTPSPDPVAKRLRFLIAKVRDERRAVERELAMRRGSGVRGLRDINELRCEGSCAEEPPVIHDDLSAATRPLSPAAVA